MKPARFAYLRPETLDAALAALAEYGEDARILAGGQSLAPMLNMRIVQPALLVDIAGLSELSGTAVEAGAIVVGAAVTQADLLAAMGSPAPLHPLLAAALPRIGHHQTRSRGTVCGSIAHADPSAELPLCLAALGGAVVLRSARSRRLLPAADFFEGILSTACGPDEMIEAVRFPLPAADTGHAFAEVAMRHGDFAMAAVAAVVTPHTVRLAVGGVADMPAVREWPALEGSDLDDALAAFARDLDARDDQHATADYRRAMVRRLGRKAIAEARANIGAPATSPALPSAGTSRIRAPALHVPADRRHTIRFALNGRPVSGEAEPRMLLTDFLRHVLGATGTHVGCEHGVCGACTVRLDGAAVRACLLYAVQADGRRVDTVEGLAAADGTLSPLQAAFRRHHALQCGFCTAGILMSLTDYLEKHPGADEAAIRDVLSGHLCRCTGYTGIVEAALEAAGGARDA